MNYTHKESKDQVFASDRRKLPMVLNWHLDDLKMSDAAFRVYLHLVRRAGKDDSCFPSCKSIGEHCWPHLTPSRARRKATECIQELVSFGLVEVEHRKSENGADRSNVYFLNDCSEWVENPASTARGGSLSDRGGDRSVIGGGSLNDRGGDRSTIGGVIAQRSHKISNSEDLQIEDLQIEEDPPLPPQSGGACVEVEVLLGAEVWHQDPEVTKSDRQDPQELPGQLTKTNSPARTESSGAVDDEFNKTSEYQQKILLRAELHKLPIRGQNGEKYNPGFVEACRKWIKDTPAYKNRACTVHDATAYISNKMKSVEGLERLIAIAKSALEQPTGVTGLPQGVEDILNKIDKQRRNKIQ